MEIIPALDLKAGRCVRLYQGDFAQETVFSSDPLDVAQRWQNEGAERLHIVDLDGAATGEQTNYDVIRELVAVLHIPVQVGGGVRTRESAEGLLELGVSRVVLGTAAIEAPALVEALCRNHGGEQVVVAVDSRNGYVATRGWVEGTTVLASDLVQSMGALGVPRFLCTDIGRDGTLTHPNFDALRQLVRSTSGAILASGGISSEEDIRELTGTGVEGAILGRALYTGDIRLEAAIEAAKPNL